MKTLVLSTIIAIFTLNFALAQNEWNKDEENQTLFMPSSKITGWFFEMNNSYTKLNEKESWMPGFAGGIVINKSVYLGMRFKSLSWYETYLNYNNLLPEECYLNGGYGGLYMEPAFNAKKLIHVSFPITLGGGGATYLSKEKYPEYEEDGEIDYHRKELSSSPFFAFEPGVNVELNVTGFMKITSGYSYRWLVGLNLENTNKTALNGGSFNIGLKFGKF